MAMLAEGKKKQKWSQDPRNKTWSTDTDRFGYQMLTKMGWSDGKGLGASESGTTSHVKISLKNDNLGVGAKTSHDDNWLAHQDDFNSLLAHLNNANNTGNASEDQSSNDMESIARKSKKRVFYERFIKSKNTSSYSATDMACIMGKRSKSAPDTPVDKSEDEDSDGSCASCPALQETNSLGLTTINSSQSVQEYFAMKMAELKKKRQRQSTEEMTLEKSTEDKEEELNCNLESNVQADKTKKKRKQKREKNDEKEKKNTEGNSDESSLSSDEKGDQCLGSENDKKKKKNKKRKREENEEVGEEVVEKKRKKKSKAEYNDSLEEEKNSKKGKKKDKKVKDEQIETDSTTIADNSDERSSKKAKKSKTKEKDIEEISKSKNDKMSKKLKKQASNEKFCENGKLKESSKKKSKNKNKRKKL